MQKNPYYIVAPEFTTKSGGILFLYKLCDLLNKKGCRAFILHESQKTGAPIEYPFNLQTPFLSHKEARHHIQFDCNPIIIMPETGKNIIENYPLIFRYVLNYIGFFPGEPKETDPEFQIEKKFFWAFSTDIAKKHKIPQERVMFTPIVDTEIFFPPKVENRNGKACYLGKYAEIHSQKLPKEIGKKNYVFYRNPNFGLTPTRKEYAEKLRQAELIYIYKNTSVIMDALMCGCPVVCVPNEYCKFTEKDMIGMQEIGLNGIAIGTSDKEIKRAKATVHLARDRILQLMQEYEAKVDFFIQETQKISHDVKFSKNKFLNALNDYFASKRHLTFSEKLWRETKRIFRNINIFGVASDGIVIKVPYVFKSTAKRLKKLLR